MSRLLHSGVFSWFISTSLPRVFLHCCVRYLVLWSSTTLLLLFQCTLLCPLQPPLSPSPVNPDPTLNPFRVREIPVRYALSKAQRAQDLSHNHFRHPTPSIRLQVRNPCAAPLMHAFPSRPLKCSSNRCPHLPTNQRTDANFKKKKAATRFAPNLADRSSLGIREFRQILCVPSLRQNLACFREKKKGV